MTDTWLGGKDVARLSTTTEREGVTDCEGAPGVGITRSRLGDNDGTGEGISDGGSDVPGVGTTEAAVVGEILGDQDESGVSTSTEGGGVADDGTGVTGTAATEAVVEGKMLGDNDGTGVLTTTEGGGVVDDRTGGTGIVIE